MDSCTLPIFSKLVFQEVCRSNVKNLDTYTYWGVNMLESCLQVFAPPDLVEQTFIILLLKVRRSSKKHPLSLGGRATLPLRRQCWWRTSRWKIFNFCWTSFQDSVFQLFQRVENKHGWMLVSLQFMPWLALSIFHAPLVVVMSLYLKVSHALAYVTASKSGVSEPEIEDFISLDDKVDAA